jgi:hypothetical protein
VDGDSASSTEVYALLSALARLPIQQGIAVTGSVNQHGEIQAIGGATAKIEGYFDVCKEKGLTGEQGVIIPAANAPTLMLREDVVAAVAAGQFHIYPVTSIDEGISILTRMPSGERGRDGGFAQGTVNRRVDDALRELALRLKNFGRPPAPKDGAGKPDDDENNDVNGEPAPPREPGLPGDEPEGPDDEPGLPGDEPDVPGDEPGPPSDEPEPFPGSDLPVDETS